MSAAVEQPAVLGQPASEPHQAPVVGEPRTDSTPVIGEPLFPNGVKKGDVNDDVVAEQENLTADSSVNGVYAVDGACDSSPEVLSVPDNTSSAVSEESEAPAASSVESPAEDICDEPADKEVGVAASDGALETTAASVESDSSVVQERAIASDEVVTDDHKEGKSVDHKEAETRIKGEEEESAAQIDTQKELKEEIEDSKASDDVETSNPAEDKSSAEQTEVAEGVVESPNGSSEKEVYSEPHASSEADVEKAGEGKASVKDTSSYREETVESSPGNGELVVETEKPYAEEVVEEKKDRELTEDDFQKQTTETEYVGAEGGESLQYSERELSVNGEDGYQCVQGGADPSAEREQDFSNGKEQEQSSLRFIKLPLIFTGLAIAAAGIAFTSISRASLGSK